jgi:hypothetical protein
LVHQLGVVVALHFAVVEVGLLPSMVVVARWR